MSDHIEQVAHDTTRCRLPFPINDVRQWMEVQVTGLQTCLEPGPRNEFQTMTVRVSAPYTGSYGQWEGGGGEDLEFYLCSGGFCASGDCVAFPTVGIIVAHVILNGYGGEFLALPPRAASRWAELQRSRRDRFFDHEPTETWQRRPEAERVAIFDGRNAAGLAEAVAAHNLLDAETRGLTGRGFDELLASGRPYDPEESRYLDGAREYVDGSGGDDEAPSL